MTRSLILTIHGDFDALTQYEEMRTDTLLNILEKNKDADIRDYVIVVNKTSDNDSIPMKYSYDENGKLKAEECDVHVAVKEKLKNRKKSFSQREKLDLLLEYINVNKKMPEAHTIYKQCPIGKFMNDANKWSEICEMISEAKVRK